MLTQCIVAFFFFLQLTGNEERFLERISWFSLPNLKRHEMKKASLYGTRSKASLLLVGIKVGKLARIQGKKTLPCCKWHSFVWSTESFHSQKLYQIFHWQRGKYKAPSSRKVGWGRGCLQISIAEDIVVEGIAPTPSLPPHPHPAPHQGIWWRKGGAVTKGAESA